VTPTTLHSLADLSEAEHSAFFWKCIGRALLLQITLLVATFLTNIAIQFMVTFIGLFFVENASQLDPTIRRLQWVSLVPWTLAAFWWYTRWLLRNRFGSVSVVFQKSDSRQQPNNALQRTLEDSRR
jgi:hypothetical protein